MAFTVYLIHDGTQTTLGTLDSDSRNVQTFDANIKCKEFGIRIAGTDEAWLKVYGIIARCDVREEEIQ